MVRPTLKNRQRSVTKQTTVLMDTYPTRRIVADQQFLQKDDKEEQKEYQKEYREKRKRLRRRYRERLEEVGVTGEKKVQTLRETRPNQHRMTIMNISKKTDKKTKKAKKTIEGYL